MPFAVQLYFDAVTETAIRDIWRELAERGISTYMYTSGNRPHISLAIYQEIEVGVCQDRLKTFAGAYPTFQSIMPNLGIFPSQASVLFVGPTVTPQLLDIHNRVHTLLSDIGSAPVSYYLPGYWNPHCTLAMDLPPENVPPAVSVSMSLSFPIACQVEEIGLIEFRPVKELFTYKLVSLTA